MTTHEKKERFVNCRMNHVSESQTKLRWKQICSLYRTRIIIRIHTIFPPCHFEMMAVYVQEKILLHHFAWCVCVASSHFEHAYVMDVMVLL